MKTVNVTKVIGGGPVDGSIHLEVEQEGTNETVLIVLPADSLDDFMKTVKGKTEAKAETHKKEAK